MKTTITLLIALSSIIIGVALLNQQTTQAPKALNTSESILETNSVQQPHTPEQASDKPTASANKQTLQAQPALVYHEPINYDLPGELIEHLDELFERYHSGDLKAGYLLAMNFMYCNSESIYSEDNLNEKLRSWDWSAQNIPQVVSSQKALSAKESLTEAFYYCKDVPIELRKQDLKLLEEVAAQGFTPAQYDYGNRYEPHDLSKHESYLSKEEINKIGIRANKATAFLTDAARHGHLMSLKELSDRYRKVENTDLVRSLAYGITFLNYASKAQHIERYTKILFKLKNEMTPIEVEQAQNLSETLIEEIRKNGTIYEY